MYRIVSSITSFAQHFKSIAEFPDPYCPSVCPHCGLKILQKHGFYYRKADRCSGYETSHNPVPIRRYRCAGCGRTCSRLPLCIAPRRWFDWGMQQTILLLLLNGYSLHHCARHLPPDRRTVRRWWDWLRARTERFAFFLRARFPELGRSADGGSFWRTVMSGMSLANAMAWLDRELSVP